MNKYWGILTIVVWLAGCSTHKTHLSYEGPGQESLMINKTTINEVVVSDERGTDSDWLGAIRGGYGNRLKTLRTVTSTDQVIDEIYSDALEQVGVLTDDVSAPYKLRVAVTKFDCSYYFNREAHAHVKIALVRHDNSRVVFSKTYKSDETEAGVGAGIFGDVDTLRNLAETAINNTVDKMLTDDEFLKALDDHASSSNSTRLEDLKRLYDQGLVSESEYEEQKSRVLSEI